jgi:catechol 2,3-dioxygenase-like lactoylglutathione lyase family enzyme
MTEPYVPAQEQLVLELFVRDAARSRDFYKALGFEILRDSGSFVVLGWEGHQMLLDERGDVVAPTRPAANVRVMVRDVDAAWERARELGLMVLVPIADRPYGLRDFTLLDPDGFGVRFASRIGEGLRAPGT